MNVYSSLSYYVGLDDNVDWTLDAAAVARMMIYGSLRGTLWQLATYHAGLALLQYK